MEKWRREEKPLGNGERKSAKWKKTESKVRGGHLGDKAKRTQLVTCNPMCHAVMAKRMSVKLQEATSSMSQPIRREEWRLQSVCSAVSVCVSSQ